ncbi:hypothetical protein SDJN03_13880, partial [Cucurbita argyrosperma subsp. sororia]
MKCLLSHEFYEHFRLLDFENFKDCIRIAGFRGSYAQSIRTWNITISSVPNRFDYILNQRSQTSTYKIALPIRNRFNHTRSPGPKISAGEDDEAPPSTPILEHLHQRTSVFFPLLTSPSALLRFGKLPPNSPAGALRCRTNQNLRQIRRRPRPSENINHSEETARPVAGTS